MRYGPQKGHPTRGSHSWRLLAAGSTALLLLLSGGLQTRAAAPGDSLVVTAPNNTTVAQSDDYATQVLAAPWHMADPSQINYVANMTPPVIAADGYWTSQTIAADPQIFLQYQGWPGSIDYLGEHSGNNYPIDTARFTHLHFRMYSSGAGAGWVLWFPSRVFTPGGIGPHFAVISGWHTYDIDLTRDDTGHNNWQTRSNWNGLRLDPLLQPGPGGATIKLDWVRLTPATSPPVHIAWQAAGNVPVSLYLDKDQNAANGVEMTIASGLAAGITSYTWNTSGLAPGTYYIRVVAGSVSGYSGALNINQAPVLNLSAPGPGSGEDFATTVLGHPWTITGPGDLSHFLQASANITNITAGQGYLQASATNNDPQLLFLNGDSAHAIDTSKYHYLSYNLYLAAPNAPPVNGQYFQWNGGPRATWAHDASLQWQQTLPILGWYNHWLRPAHDLRTVPLVPGSTQGWTGTESFFRLDPHEEVAPGVLPPFFRIGDVRLTADPSAAAGGQTTISWTAIKATGNVALFYSSTSGGARTPITDPAHPAALAAGSYAWAVPATLAPGNYWITAQTSDGLNTFSQTSLVPLTVIGLQACGHFSDVPTTHPFYQYITDLACRGVISGYGDGTFRPGNPTTRGQQVKIVVLGFGKTLVPPPASGHTFADVLPGSTYFPFVETAAADGIVSGYVCGGPNEPCDNLRRPYFRPNANVTRGQLSKIVVSAAGWALQNPPNPSFSDVARGTAFYTFVQTAACHGIISGYGDGTFRPGNNATRGQIAKIVDLALSSPASCTSGPSR